MKIKIVPERGTFCVVYCLYVKKNSFSRWRFVRLYHSKDLAIREAKTMKEKFLDEEAKLAEKPTYID